MSSLDFGAKIQIDPKKGYNTRLRWVSSYDTKIKM